MRKNWDRNPCNELPQYSFNILFIWLVRSFVFAIRFKLNVRQIYNYCHLADNLLTFIFRLEFLTSSKIICAAIYGFHFNKLKIDKKGSDFYHFQQLLKFNILFSFWEWRRQILYNVHICILAQNKFKIDFDIILLWMDLDDWFSVRVMQI